MVSKIRSFSFPAEWREALSSSWKCHFFCSSHNISITWHFCSCGSLGKSLWILSLNSVKKPWWFWHVALYLEVWLFNPPSLRKSSCNGEANWKTRYTKQEHTKQWWVVAHSSQPGSQEHPSPPSTAVGCPQISLLLCWRESVSGSLLLSSSVLKLEQPLVSLCSEEATYVVVADGDVFVSL